MTRVVVVGGGIAGHEAAWAAKRTDPGCRVVLLQEEPYPLYSACVLADYISGELSRERVFLLHPNDYKRAEIEFFPNNGVRDWDPVSRKVMTENREFHYDSLILAMGSRPIVPSIPGVGLEGVLNLKTLADAERLAHRSPGRCVVIGGGPVGVECALALASKGWKVSLVEMMPRVLPRLFDEPLAFRARCLLEEMGVMVFLGSPVKKFLGNGRLEAVETEERILDADVAVVVLGMRPEVSLATKAGVEVGRSGGIQVDEFMGAGLSGVYACGDCVESEDLITSRKGLHMLWGNAKRQGVIAGCNAGGERRRYVGSLNITTLKVGQKALASLGFTKAEFPSEGARILRRGDHMGNEISFVLWEGRVVGIQALGCVERVGGFLGVILSKIKAPDLINRRKRDPREAWALRELEGLIRSQF